MEDADLDVGYQSRIICICTSEQQSTRRPRTRCCFSVRRVDLFTPWGSDTSGTRFAPSANPAKYRYVARTYSHLQRWSQHITNELSVPQQGMYTQSGGLMYWIPPPDQGSAPVCLGTAISPEEAAGAQARMQQTVHNSAYNQPYQPQMNTTPTSNLGAPTQYQPAPYTGGNYSQASSQYSPFPNPTNAPGPANISTTSSNNPGTVNTSGPAKTSNVATAPAPRPNWNSSGGSRVVLERPGSGTAPPTSTASPSTSTPPGHWFKPPSMAGNNLSSSTKPYDPYASEFIPGRNDRSLRNGMGTGGQGWNK